MPNENDKKHSPKDNENFSRRWQTHQGFRQDVEQEAARFKREASPELKAKLREEVFRFLGLR